MRQEWIIPDLKGREEAEPLAAVNIFFKIRKRALLEVPDTTSLVGWWPALLLSL